MPGKNKRAGIYLLPNLLTAGNFTCGFAAIINIMGQNYQAGIWLIMFGYIFDALDGRAARMVGGDSDFGREFDSLADVVTFGVAPACLAYKFVLEDFHRTGLFLACAYATCGAVRLARFDMLSVHNSLESKEEKPAASKDFIGMPIPAAAGVIVSVALFLFWIYDKDLPRAREAVGIPKLGAWRWALPPFMLLVSLLMVSKVKYPSFKAIDWNTKKRVSVLVGLIAFIYLAIALHEGVLPLLFIGYMIYGLIRPLLSRKLQREIEQEEDEEE